jgi:predicted enzyme related to lactoylglutathione lyase
MRRAAPLEERVVMMSRPDQSAELKFVVTNTLIVADIRRSVAFYRDVLGATVLREGEPTLLRFGNIWLTTNVGGGPTDDKPEVVASPPRDPNLLSIFLNLRVTDIGRFYDLGLRVARNSSLSLKSMRRNCGATCATRMGTSLRSDNRQ